MHRGKPESSSCQKAYLSSKSEQNSSNLTLVRVVSKCFGPSAVVVTKGLLSDHAKERDPLYKEGIKIATYLILV